MDESRFGKNWSVKSAHPESTAYDHVEGNACLKKCFKINRLKTQARINLGHPQDPVPVKTN